MEIKTVVTGYLYENCYLLTIDDYVLVIDPGDDYDRIKNEIDTKKVLAVLITHYHFDHIGALNNLLKDYNVNIIDYRSNKKQVIGPFSFEIINTPGHKQDSVTFYFKKNKIMFTGDFLFKESIGRCDLSGGSINEMQKSINMIKKFDHDITIYPGHGKITNLGYELKHNIYLGGTNE